MLAAGLAQAQDDWALSDQDLPTALMPGEAYTGSVEAENTGSTTWDTDYELVSITGPTSAAIFTDRWGLDAVPVTTPTGPGGVLTFDVSGEAPPWVTLAYDDPFTPTLQPVVATFENGWTMSDGTDIFGIDKATEDVTILPADFPDVPLSSWAFGAITEAQLAVSGNADFITQGYDDGTFRPNAGVTRDQMAVFVARAAGLTGSAPATPTFPDVTEGFAYQAVEQCVAAGIVQGFGDGTYKPGLAVTRDQLAVYVQRAAGLTTAAYAGGFSDVPDDYWAADSIQACVDASIVQGYEGGTYQPLTVVNRATMAVFMIRGLATDVLLGGPATTDVDLSAWGTTAGLILPGEADYYGYSNEDTNPDFAYVALDAMRVADGDVSFSVDGGAAVTVALDRSDSRAEIEASGGIPYVIAYTDISGLGVGDHTVTISLPNGAVFDVDFTVE